MNTSELEEHLKTRQERYTLNGFEFTYHAMARMCERHIRLDWVREALNSPVSKMTARKHQYRGPFATVYINPVNKTIITVGYGRRNDPRNNTTNYTGHATFGGTP